MLFALMVSFTKWFHMLPITLSVTDLFLMSWFNTNFLTFKLDLLCSGEKKQTHYGKLNFPPLGAYTEKISCKMQSEIIVAYKSLLIYTQNCTKYELFHGSFYSMQATSTHPLYWCVCSHVSICVQMVKCSRLNYLALTNPLLTFYSFLCDASHGLADVNHHILLWILSFI